MEPFERARIEFLWIILLQQLVMWRNDKKSENKEEKKKNDRRGSVKERSINDKEKDK